MINMTRRLFLGRTGAAAAGAAALSAKPAPAARLTDDGPLLADDATGTNAYALYAAGDPNRRVNATRQDRT